MSLSTTDHGILTNCYSQDWIQTFVKMFQSQLMSTNVQGYTEWNTVVGSSHHILFSRLLEKCGFTQEFGKPIIISLKLRVQSLNPHCDYPLTEKFGKPFKSFLIPLNNFESSSTVIFHQTSKDIIGKHAVQSIIERLPVLPANENSCGSCVISHVSNEVKKRLSVKSILPWLQNSILYWNSNLLHCSCAYEEKFGPSRDALVIWTIKD